MWSIRVDAAFLVQQLISRFWFCDDDHGRVEDFQRIDSPIFLSPFVEPRVLSVSMNDIPYFERCIYFFPNPVNGIWCAFPRTGTVGGPGGSLGSRRPTRNSFQIPNIANAISAKTIGLTMLPSVMSGWESFVKGSFSILSQFLYIQMYADTQPWQERTAKVWLNEPSARNKCCSAFRFRVCSSTCGRISVIQTVFPNWSVLSESTSVVLD